uniref:Uncharacterized protein n=1 Tax=Lates calcarifer TaxID=8187 RepID=A0A4W6FXI8_LATCA
YTVFSSWTPSIKADLTHRSETLSLDHFHTYFSPLLPVNLLSPWTVAPLCVSLHAGPGVRHVAHLLSPFNSSLPIRLSPSFPLFQALITSWSGSIFANAVEMSRGHCKVKWSRFVLASPGSRPLCY